MKGIGEHKRWQDNQRKNSAYKSRKQAEPFRSKLHRKALWRKKGDSIVS
jgi:hypothetical protein